MKQLVFLISLILFKCYIITEIDSLKGIDCCFIFPCLMNPLTWLAVFVDFRVIIVSIIRLRGGRPGF